MIVFITTREAARHDHDSLMVTIRPRRQAGASSASRAAPPPRRHRRRGRDDAGGDHHRHVGRQTAAQRAQQEQDGADQDASLAPQHVSDLPAKQRADDRAEQQRAHTAEREDGKCARDDPGVVAEQQTTERGDDREPGQELLVRTRHVLGCGAAPVRSVRCHQLPLPPQRRLGRPRLLNVTCRRRDRKSVPPGGSEFHCVVSHRRRTAPPAVLARQAPRCPAASKPRTGGDHGRPL